MYEFSLIQILLYNYRVEFPILMLKHWIVAIVYRFQEIILSKQLKGALNPKS
jgi:hypothetical protein